MISIVALYGCLGAVAGVLSGLLGVGGGIVIVPMLVLTFSWQGFTPDLIMRMALGTSMASIIFTSISSSLAHHRRSAVDWSVVKSVTPGIIIGTYGGSFLASKVPSQYLQLFFVAFLLYVASQMISGKKPKPTRHLPGTTGMNTAGGCIGVVSSLVGIGGGTLTVPFLLWHNVEVRRAIGTSAAVGFPIAVAGCLGYIVNGMGVPARPEWSVGYLYLPTLVGIVLVSMLTAPMGVRLAHRLPVDRLKKGFAVLLLAMAAKMFLGAV